MNNKVKVLVLGNPCIGKTKLIDTLSDSDTLYHYMPTYGVDCSSLFYGNKLIKFYDAGGAKRLEPIVNEYLRVVDVIVLAFSHNHKKSLLALDDLYAKAKQLNPQAQILLTGLQVQSKAFIHERVTQEEIKHFINQHGIKLFCSCDSQENYGLEEFQSQLVYYSKLKDKLTEPLFSESSLNQIWSDKAPAVDNVKTLILNTIKTVPATFFSRQERHYKCLLMQVLNQFASSDNSLTNAKLLLSELELFNSMNNRRLDSQIGFAKHKLTRLQIQRTIDSNEFSIASLI